MDVRRQFAKAMLAIVVASLTCGLSFATSDSERLAKLNALKQARPRGLISVDISGFRSLVEEAPRSYHLFVMLSADLSICKPCAPLRKQLEKLAKDYASLPTQKQSSKKVFFLEVKLSSSDQEFLALYGIRHVPVFYAFKAGTSRTYPKQLDDQSPDNYPIQQAGLAQNRLKEFVNSRSGSQLAVIRGGYQIPFVQTVRSVMPLIMAVAGIAAALAVISEAYKSPMLWFSLVVLVYIFSVGGGHYSWIHNTPLAVVNNDGVLEYIASGSRSQYVAEGFFVSVTCVSISVLVILIQELPGVLPNKAGQTLVGSMMVMLTIAAIAALLVMYHIVSVGAINSLRLEAAQVLVSQKLTILVLLLDSMDSTENAPVSEV